MKSYDLFAAKDGDVFRDSEMCETEEAALTWAATRIIEEFRLDDVPADFDEACGECDGVLLEPTHDPVEQFAEGWALAQMQVLSCMNEHFGDRFKNERSRCLRALVDLMNAIRP